MQKGFTLLELMIALALSLMLIEIIQSLYLSSLRTNTRIKQFSSMLTDAQLAFFYLNRDIQSVGYVGCGRISDMELANSSFSDETSLVGWHRGKSTSTANQPLIKRSVMDSDTLLIQGMNTEAITVIFARKNKITYAEKSHFHYGDYLFISDCLQGEAFINGISSLVNNYDTGALVGRIKKIFYYVGDTGRKTFKHRSIYALYRQNLKSQGGSPAELIENIEKMIIKYGVKTSDHPIVFYYANEVLHWSAINCVLIRLIFQDSNQKKGEHEKSLIWEKLFFVQERPI